MSFIVVAPEIEVAPGTMKSFVVGNNRTILVVNHEGRFYAMDNKCTHAGGNLSRGKLEGTIVTCPRHGSRFDVTTGACVSGPHIGFLKLRTKDEPSYPVKVEDGIIKISFI
jgi:3-phenylpropionate/trans-cinnamate dioxygenase ferredoxin component